MVYVVVCPSCGRARASCKVVGVECRFCGRVYDAEPVFSGGLNEARSIVSKLNMKSTQTFRKARLPRYKWIATRKKPKVELSADMAKILYILEERGEMTVRELSYILGLKPRRVRGILQALRKAGLAECIIKPKKTLESFLEERDTP
ncbi:MAG: transcriptional regulator [Thaumarchaeota archaeon]|jgi:transcription initiation factor IIE alpha subunit|nr:transcriptional regulator [Candidatus Geocrenenecus arthurdayi]MCL7390212.1 transcriptional regulator [Candidatus Geocrenenecus arthurdayi]